MTIGSKPLICAPMLSIFVVASNANPAPEPATPHTIDATSDIRLRILRRARNRFHVKGSLGEDGDDAGADAALGEAAVEL